MGSTPRQLRGLPRPQILQDVHGQHAAPDGRASHAPDPAGCASPERYRGMTVSRRGRSRPRVMPPSTIVPLCQQIWLQDVGADGPWGSAHARTAGSELASRAGRSASVLGPIHEFARRPGLGAESRVRPAVIPRRGRRGPPPAARRGAGHARVGRRRDDRARVSAPRIQRGGAPARLDPSHRERGRRRRRPSRRRPRCVPRGRLRAGHLR